MMSSIEDSKYLEKLRETIVPRLSYCMQLVCKLKPNDPIEFIGTHLNHLSQNNSLKVSI